MRASILASIKNLDLHLILSLHSFVFPLKIVEQSSEDVHLADLVVDCVVKERKKYTAVPSRRVMKKNEDKNGGRAYERVTS